MDPISDFITRINNAILREKPTVPVPRSSIKLAIIKTLKEKGYIKDYEELDREIVIKLKYVKGKSRISGIVRVSKPSQRIYTSYKDIPKVLNGIGVCILSTPKGILSTDMARKNKVGGEIICKVW